MAPRELQLARLSRQEIALILITMVWGGTFLVIHNALAAGGPLAFVGLRFGAAALVTALLSLRALRGFTARELLAGSAIGICIFLGYGLQTYGLQTISSSKSAFITAFYVPLVPLMQWLVLRRPPHLMSWVGVALAFPGLLLLAGPQGASVAFGRGELLTAVGSIAIAGEVILISLFAGRVNLIRVTVVQLAVASIIAITLMPVTGEPIPPFSWLLVGSAVSLGLASAVIQLVMNWAQKTVSATRATLIYTGEPVWAGIIGRIAGERLPALALLGGALIVLATVVSELRLPGRRVAEKVSA